MIRASHRSKDVVSVIVNLQCVIVSWDTLMTLQQLKGNCLID